MFRGSTEAERIENARYYDRIMNFIERAAPVIGITEPEKDALQYCVDVLIDRSKMAPAREVQDDDIMDQPDQDRAAEPAQVVKKSTTSVKKLRPIP